jgi:hypothetical protein
MAVPPRRCSLGGVAAYFRGYRASPYSTSFPKVCPVRTMALVPIRSESFAHDSTRRSIRRTTRAPLRVAVKRPSQSRASASRGVGFQPARLAIASLDPSIRRVFTLPDTCARPPADQPKRSVPQPGLAIVRRDPLSSIVHPSSPVHPPGGTNSLRIGARPPLAFSPHLCKTRESPLYSFELTSQSASSTSSVKRWNMIVRFLSPALAPFPTALACRSLPSSGTVIKARSTGAGSLRV